MYILCVEGRFSESPDDNVIRSFIFRYIDAVEVARPRDMSRNHVVSTEYSDRFLPTEIYRIPDDEATRTEIAEMETVL